MNKKYMNYKSGNVKVMRFRFIKLLSIRHLEFGWANSSFQYTYFTQPNAFPKKCLIKLPRTDT